MVGGIPASGNRPEEWYEQFIGNAIHTNQQACIGIRRGIY